MLPILAHWLLGLFFILFTYVKSQIIFMLQPIKTTMHQTTKHKSLKEFVFNLFFFSRWQLGYNVCFHNLCIIVILSLCKCNAIAYHLHCTCITPFSLFLGFGSGFLLLGGIGTKRYQPPKLPCYHNSLIVLATIHQLIVAVDSCHIIYIWVILPTFHNLQL